MLSVHEVLQRRYRIVRLIGKGSIGAVYEAIDESFGESVAIKEVRYELTDSIDQGQLELLRNAFKREAKSLAKARHPAVPYVRDYFLDRERQYLVMDMVEGDDLGSLLLARGRPFAVDEVLDWTEQLLGALDHLQNLVPAVVHGDIKPKNLKLAPGGQLKLLDLGVAKTVDDRAFTVRPSDLEFTALNYLSFEQVLHVIDPSFRDFILEKHKNRALNVLKQSCDARSDIYMVGATIYYLLTARPATDVVRRTIDAWEGRPDPLPNPLVFNREMPESLSKCILKALAIDRNDRYNSASDMLHALQEETHSSTQSSPKERAAAASNGNGHSICELSEKIEPPPYQSTYEDATAPQIPPFTARVGPAPAVIRQHSSVPTESLTLSILPPADLGEHFETQIVEVPLEGELRQEIGGPEATDDFATTVQDKSAHEIEVEAVSASPAPGESDTAALLASEAESGVHAESESLPVDIPNTYPQPVYPDTPQGNSIAEALSPDKDQEQDNRAIPTNTARTTRNSSGKSNTPELWNELTSSTVPAITGSRWVTGIPRVPLWLSLTAAAVALTVLGIVVLLWLLSMGRPAGDISAANAAPRRPSGSRVVEPPAAESSKVQQPVPQVQTAQPGIAEEQPIAAESPVPNEFPREESPKRTEPKVRYQKPAAERQGNSKPQAVNEPPPTQPKQEKKKITVDDLINDN